MRLWPGAAQGAPAPEQDPQLVLTGLVAFQPADRVQQQAQPQQRGDSLVLLGKKDGRPWGSIGSSA